MTTSEAAGVSTTRAASSREGEGLRVLLVAHHHLDRDAGVSGATLALGAALERRGCAISYYCFDDAFGGRGGREIPRMLAFPWKVASHLARVAGAFDVVDATTGDAWVWASRGRRGGERTALVTRAHGLEQVMSRELRARAQLGEGSLSWKYPLYHGGFRLWEVRQSLVRADAQIFLNEGDRELAVRELGVPAAHAFVLPNGVPDALLDARVPITQSDPSAPIALAFVGSWIDRKGIAALPLMTEELARRDVPFTLRLLGTGVPESQVLSAFSPLVRDRLRIVPRYEPEMLTSLLDGAEVLLHPSWSEGFSLALAEGMALGLAPVATHAGGAATLIRHGESGLLLDDASSRETAIALADAVQRLSLDSVQLARMRTAARAATAPLRWNAIAERTVTVYADAMVARRRSVR